MNLEQTCAPFQLFDHLLIILHMVRHISISRVNEVTQNEGMEIIRSVITSCNKETRSKRLLVNQQGN
jgi:hypothetical protein